MYNTLIFNILDKIFHLIKFNNTTYILLILKIYK